MIEKPADLCPLNSQQIDCYYIRNDANYRSNQVEVTRCMDLSKAKGTYLPWAKNLLGHL